VSGRRHDFIGNSDPGRTRKIVAKRRIITLEDAETGEQIEINTGDRKTRLFLPISSLDSNGAFTHARRNNVDTDHAANRQRLSAAIALVFKQRERHASGSLAGRSTGGWITK